MSRLEFPKYFKDRVSRIFAKVQIPKIDNQSRELINAGIQVTGALGLASYTYRNSTYGILPFLCSVVAVGGTYNFLKINQKKSLTSRFESFRDEFSFIADIFFNEKLRKWSSWEFANGIFAYSTGVYAFSEAFKRNDRAWIPSLALAATGYYFTKSSIESLDGVLRRRPLLKCCQLMSVPALVACAATYLFYFRNHTEGWLKCLSYLVTAAAGYNFTYRGCSRSGYTNDLQLILLKSIEMWMGGSFLCISCTALAIYSYTHDFIWPLTVSLGVGSLLSIFIICGSLAGFKQYLAVEGEVFLSIVGMIVGPVAFSSAFLMVACMEESEMMPITFLFLTSAGLLILGSALHRLYTNAPRQLFHKYCRRILGPILTVDSSMVSAYVTYYRGWRSSLLTMPFVTAGIYVAYRGFRKEERTSAS